MTNEALRLGSIIKAISTDRANRFAAQLARIVKEYTSLVQTADAKGRAAGRPDADSLVADLLADPVRVALEAFARDIGWQAHQAGGVIMMLFVREAAKGLLPEGEQPGASALIGSWWSGIGGGTAWGA
jgi:hypothetical protein